MSVRVAVHTLGCRVNQADTIALEDELRAREATLVGHRDVADIYVLNTCTVTHTADADARKIARRMRRQNPDARVVVTGCYAQVARDALASMPEIDLVVGNDGKSGLAGALLPSAPAKPTTPEHGPVGAQAPGARISARRRHRLWPSRVRKAHITALPETRTRPFLKVQDGCDYSCAFCIIPEARGVSRSFSVAHVQAEATRYAELGARELVLTGIHLGHWGRDLTPRVPFDAMLEALLEGLDPRIARVRLGSVEPNEVTPALIALLREHPRLCPHLHVPLQSGDDAVLRRMRRLYSTAEYAEVIGSLRSALPHAAIGADVLVGHPGEDEASFARTLALLDRLDWTYLHVFPFSPRRGTASAAMPDQVPDAARAERVRLLVRRSGVRRHLFHRGQVGQDREWLALEPTAGGMKVLSRNYVHGVMPADDALQPGELVRGRVVEAGAERVQVARAAAGVRP